VAAAAGAACPLALASLWHTGAGMVHLPQCRLVPVAAARPARAVTLALSVRVEQRRGLPVAYVRPAAERPGSLVTLEAAARPDPESDSESASDSDLVSEWGFNLKSRPVLPSSEVKLGSQVMIRCIQLLRARSEGHAPGARILERRPTAASIPVGNSRSCASIPPGGSY
jgi:hypothetical protein